MLIKCIQPKISLPPPGKFKIPLMTTTASTQRGLCTLKHVHVWVPLWRNSFIHPNSKGTGKPKAMRPMIQGGAHFSATPSSRLIYSAICSLALYRHQHKAMPGTGHLLTGCYCSKLPQKRHWAASWLRRPTEVKGSWEGHHGRGQKKEKKMKKTIP